MKETVLEENSLVYNTHEFLIVGFLFCMHKPENHEDAMWGLINPDQSKYVHIDQVEKFLKTVQQIAIDIPLSKEDSNSSKNKENYNEKVTGYLKRLVRQKEKVIKQVLKDIKDGAPGYSATRKCVNREKLMNTIFENWARPFSIRELHYVNEKPNAKTNAKR
jgi:hypothetical protein